MTFVVIAISCLSFCLTCMPCECVCVSECLVVHTQKALLLLCCRHNSCGIDFSFSHFLCLMFNTKETVAAFWMFSSCECISWVNKYTCFMRLFKSLIPKFFFFFSFLKKRKMRTVTEGELLGKTQTDTLEGWFCRWGKMPGAASSGRKPFAWMSTPAVSLILQVISSAPKGDSLVLFWE